MIHAGLFLLVSTNKTIFEKKKYQPWITHTNNMGVGHFPGKETERENEKTRGEK